LSGGGRYRRWISFSQALKEYGLTADQLEAALRFGIVEYKLLGTQGRIVKKPDLEAKLEEIRRIPERCWIYKSEAIRKYGLTRRQIERAMAEGLVRYYERKNPYYSRAPAYMLYEPDIVANLDRIKAFPKYTERDIIDMRVYRLRSKLREKLGFYCPRCGVFVRVRRDSILFEKVWEEVLAGADVEEFRRAFIIAHYRHEHTDYDKAKEDIERWLEEEERERWRSIIRYYQNHKHKMDRYEREDYIMWIRAFKDTAVARARKHYNRIAAEMAAEDGLLNPQQEKSTKQPQELQENTKP